MGDEQNGSERPREWMRVGRIIRIDDQTREATLYTYSRRSFLVDIPEGKSLCLGWNYIIRGPGPATPDGRNPERIRADYDLRIPKSYKEEAEWFAPTKTELSLADKERRGLTLDSIRGKWPGDETDEQIFAALEELS